MTLLAIFGCTPSNRELPATLEGLSLDAIIERTTEQHGTSGEGFTSDHVSVVLQDRDGRTLEREDLRIELNDVPLSIRAGHGNYYVRHPFYRLEGSSARIDPDEDCRFRVVWPDGTHHVAGVVRAPMTLSPAQFDFPAAASREAPLVIEWADLSEPAELVVFRSHTYTDLNGNLVLEDGGPSDAAALRRTIGPGLLRRSSGRMEVPWSYLADHDGRRVSGVGIEISTRREGFAIEPFSRKSSLRATRRLVFRCELTD
jgi:hypothetical protein